MFTNDKNIIHKPIVYRNMHMYSYHKTCGFGTTNKKQQNVMTTALINVLNVKFNIYPHSEYLIQIGNYDIHV